MSKKRKKGITQIAHQPTQIKLLEKVKPAYSLVIILALLFIISRIILFAYFEQNPTDLNVYGCYASEMQIASQIHLPFYTYHKAKIQDAINYADSLGIEKPQEWQKSIYYPPLALLWMRFPQLFTDLSRITTDESLHPYRTLLRVSLMAFDVVTFFLLFIFLTKIFPDLNLAKKGLAYYTYIFSGIFLPVCLYERMDIGTALLIAASLLILFSRLHYTWSFLLLALAINFRIMPAILAPIWIVAALPVSKIGPLSEKLQWKTLIGALCVRSIWLIALCAAVFLPFYLIYGKSSIGFITDLGTRTIHIESIYGWINGCAQKLFHQSASVYYDLGCYLITSSTTPLFLKISRIVMLCIFFLACPTLIILSRKNARNNKTIPLQSTIAQAYPRLLFLLTCATLLLVIGTAPVFSPQYLIWLFPIIPLLVILDKDHVGMLSIFLIIHILSTIIYPVIYFRNILGVQTQTNGAVILTGPTLLGLVVLGIRNFSVLGLAVFMIMKSIKIATNPLAIASHPTKPKVALVRDTPLLHQNP